ncbi:nicotinamide/nicotinic acid mononucleotide adenylyltransferase 3 [Astyanax mexicanus]|uniref:Nicotinamide-nucleotide adenylyltransferase n=1 Tax=Astyanax mexicanus TaxID=7994 RepID=A0A3B1K4Y3_ASTMX|nr:nicotinamide/nicotinic acid mononucleotide adenylyltransferase 3 [Astyanax mexicanus]XP_007228729.2 nicotinamide/nicotinic acid mononucleotide adenylyltransferase 3 [Astyanax mexicanus]
MAGRIPLILLACGSFNPITYQHMRLFELARDHMHQTGLYQVVGGIVSPVGDEYAKQGLVSSQHRLAMARLALQSSDWVTVDDWESRQADWTETVVTMRYHHNCMVEKCWPSTKATPPEQTLASGPSQLKLLCGADFLETFKVPGLWADEHIEEVVGRFGLVCVSRGGLQPERTVHECDLLHKHKRNIFLVREWIRNEISATEVRRALRRGLSVKFLIPDNVIDYIREHNLYTPTSELKNKNIKLRPFTKQQPVLD